VDAPLLDIRHLNIHFPTQNGEVAAVSDLSLAIPQGESLGLVGESGSGKSATALAMMRLLPPQAKLTGEVLFSGQDLLAFP